MSLSVWECRPEAFLHFFLFQNLDSTQSPAIECYTHAVVEATSTAALS